MRLRILRYAFVGGLAALVQLVVFAALMVVSDTGARLEGVWLERIVVPLLGELVVFELVFFLVALEAAIIANFLGQREFTFPDRKDRVLSRFVSFQAIMLLGVVLQTSVYTFLRNTIFVEDTLVSTLAGTVLAIALAFAVNFTLHVLVTFRRRGFR